MSIRLVSGLTDPVLARVAYLRPVRHTILEPRFRAAMIAGVWILVAGLAVHISSQRFWRPSTAR